MDFRKIDLSVSCYGQTRTEKYDIVILPWGATEPHNLHLPYLTDCILPHDVAVDAAHKAGERAGVRCMVMPPVPFGAHNPGQRELPFCIHTRQITRQYILEDIVASLYHQGIRKLLILGGHGGNDFKGMIRDLAIDYPDLLVLSANWFEIVSGKDYFEAEVDDHAGESETSVMMHYHPELVNLAEAGSGEAKPFAVPSLNRKVAWTPRHWDKATKDSGVGDPRKASAEKGKRYVEAVTEKLAELLIDLTRHDLY
ncbi:MAG: creatininase family protein [Coprobacter sp.]|nr:creatininase family protein [Coprobacter sp.]